MKITIYCGNVNIQNAEMQIKLSLWSAKVWMKLCEGAFYYTRYRGAKEIYAKVSFIVWD